MSDTKQTTAGTRRTLLVLGMLAAISTSGLALMAAPTPVVPEDPIGITCVGDPCIADFYHSPTEAWIITPASNDGQGLGEPASDCDPCDDCESTVGWTFDLAGQHPNVKAYVRWAAGCEVGSISSGQSGAFRVFNHCDTIPYDILFSDPVNGNVWAHLYCNCP